MAETDPRTFTSEQVDAIVRRRLRQAKSEPSGMAIVVADLVERVAELEARLAEMERA